ncbi:hypothetical protein BpHYR1_018694 [Brachionus plicatilis]|uniref:Secreted protein n=1 Tax=Brachionus plicatilis TaxID=10195 RepID=A0A3M7S5G0_BRAPC|nr:hypothetical protein BpHYR1_018694 [Brachionus plicatilis]
MFNLFLSFGLLSSAVILLQVPGQIRLLNFIFASLKFCCIEIKLNEILKFLFEFLNLTRFQTFSIENKIKNKEKKEAIRNRLMIWSTNKHYLLIASYAMWAHITKACFHATNKNRLVKSCVTFCRQNYAIRECVVDGVTFLALLGLKARLKSSAI